jgi:hypothetical protein
VVTYRALVEERRPRAIWPIGTMNRKYKENGQSTWEEKEKAKNER